MLSVQAAGDTGVAWSNSFAFHGVRSARRTAPSVTSDFAIAGVRDESTYTNPSNEGCMVR